jgi:hypothetical protein
MPDVCKWLPEFHAISAIIFGDRLLSAPLASDQVYIVLLSFFWIQPTTLSCQAQEFCWKPFKVIVCCKIVELQMEIEMYR